MQPKHNKQLVPLAKRLRKKMTKGRTFRTVRSAISHRTKASLV